MTSSSDNFQSSSQTDSLKDDIIKPSPDISRRPNVKQAMSTSGPNFGLKCQKLLYNKGLAPMPQYLKDIYYDLPRYIYVNQDLPESMVEPSTNRPILLYARNKIRTSKYTVISFIPKNLMAQFRNAANGYFLFMVILGAFPIFGVESPGMAAVPLIVIVCITAARDAFEDYRRAMSDFELNNSPIHLLQGVDNPNVAKDYVSPWRLFKKATSKVMRILTGAIKKAAIMTFAKREKKSQFIRSQAQLEDIALHRTSTVISEGTVAGGGDGGGRASSVGRPSTDFHSRKSHHLKRSEPIPHSLINPNLIEENAANNVSLTFKNKRWKDVCVGDMIRIRANEEIPADIMIISTSDIDSNCYLETKNLDGESNLKTRLAIPCGGDLSHARDLVNTKFWVECDPPNKRLYDFKGTIHYENYDASRQLINDDEKESVTYDNIALRGSTLRNTKWVVGLVIYTGAESKIMLNSGITPTKASRISRELNLSVYINFTLLFVLCFASGMVNGFFYDKTDVSRIYYEFEAYGATPAINGVLAFFVTLIIYQSLVPISLYISVEIIKTCQAFFIYSDIKMYYEKLDFPCIPKSWNISDDLGQIEYVFSDKTGTLTQNLMEFKKCTINGKSYGLAYTEAKQGLDKRNGVDVVKQQEVWKTKIAQDKQAMIDTILQYSNNDQFRKETMTFVSNSFVQDTLGESKDSEQKSADETFMIALALCHTVMTEPDTDDPNLRNFQAESPDESALVSVARDIGIVFKEKKRSTYVLEIYGEEKEYELLEMVPFSSHRKRMTCIFRTPENKIFLICKGADNVIYQRLSKSDNSEHVMSKTAIHLEDFANEGLRTLCIAQKEVDSSFIQDWIARYKEAKASIADDRDLAIENLDDEIEQGFTLLGGTAIEDKLQQGVPDSIGILSNAGIKIWVLTGDRIETAINIGFSCNLLNNEMKLLVVRPDKNDPDNVDYIEDLVSKHLIENFDLQELTPEKIDQTIKEAKKDHSTPSTNVGLIIDGGALAHIFLELPKDDPNFKKYEYLRKKFLLLGKQCKSVLCCRVSPAQKAQVVKLVRYQLSVMTLAIGDGANDVAMIQSADVGVGIAGEEGRQAVMSSDYGLGQFRYLTRLLLVHGRWSYKRLAEMVPLFFYKNVAYTFTCFWYGIYNDFDGSYFYEYTFLMFYNLAFTSLPIIFLAVFDQDVSDTVSLIVPQLYRAGILRKEWSQTKFAWYMFDGAYQSVISFFFVYLTFYKSFQNPQGLAVDHRFWMGIVAECITVVACDAYVMLQQYRWDWLSSLICVISMLLVYFWSGVWSDRIYAGEFYKAGAQTLGTLTSWCCMFIGVIICLLPRFTYDFLKRNFAPRDIDIIRERARRGEYDEYPQGYDPTSSEDVEKYKLIKDLFQHDPEALAKLDLELEKAEGNSRGSIHSEESDKNAFTKTFKTIKRKTTIQRKRANTVNEDIAQTFNKPIDLNKLRLQMLKNGEYGDGDQQSLLSRVTTTQELPGLTQAQTLMSYHTQNNINFDHVHR